MATGVCLCGGGEERSGVVGEGGEEGAAEGDFPFLSLPLYS